MKKILVLNGPNLNLLGKREPGIYGKDTYEDLCALIEQAASKLETQVTFKQSNCEGELAGWIQEADGQYDGIIINPAAYTHYSVTLLDALQAIAVPAVEVHISNIYRREGFRQHSVTAPGCVGQIAGLGFDGYVLALQYLVGIK